MERSREDPRSRLAVCSRRRSARRSLEGSSRRWSAAGPARSAEAFPHLTLHLQTGKFGENARHGPLGDSIGEESSEVDTRPDSADPDLRLGVGTDRERCVQCDAVPDELSAAVVHSSLSRKAPCCVRTFDLEAPLTFVFLGEPNVVKQGRHRDDFLVMVHALQLGDLHREEPGANDVIEEVWLGHGARLFHRPCNQGCIWNESPRQSLVSEGA